MTQMTQTGEKHWHGAARVNIQDDHGLAKAHQVRQVLKAIERLEKERDA